MDDTPTPKAKPEAEKTETEQAAKPVVEEKTKPVAEKKTEKTKPVKHDGRVKAWAFCKAFRERFADKEPNENVFSAWLTEIYNVGAFRELRLGGKWRKFLRNQGIAWKNGAITYPSDEEIKEKLKKQVEFYFSDGNLPKDEFLLEIINSGDNPEKWVNLSVLLTFKMVQKWCDEESVLASALSTSTEIEVSECQTKARRKNPLTLTAQDLEDRTTHVYGMSVNFNLDGLKEFLSSHGGILAIFNRRSRPPQTLVDVIWETTEIAAKFAENKTITYKEKDCKIVLKSKKEEEAKKNEQEELESRAKYIMRVKNLPEETDWKNFKSWMMEKNLDIKFIKLDGTEALVRMSENLASEGVEKLNGQTFEEKVLEVSEIPKEEAKAVVESLKPPTGNKRKRNDGGRGGNFRKKRRFNNKRGNKRDRNWDDGNARKKQKVEEN